MRSNNPFQWMLVALAIALVACTSGYTVPKAVRGDVPVVLTNDTIYGICSLHLTLADGSAGDAEWMHLGVFKPGGNARYNFSLKPGVYRLHVESCDHVIVRDVRELPISEPTNLILNAVGEQFAFTKPQSDVPGYRRVTIDVQLSKERQQNEQQQLESATAPTCKGSFEACGGSYGECCGGLICTPKPNDVSWCEPTHR